MAVNEDWEQTVISTDATTGIDEQGRLVIYGITEFTCPECGNTYEVEVTVPIPEGTSDAGDSDAQC